MQPSQRQTYICRSRCNGTRSVSSSELYCITYDFQSLMPRSQWNVAFGTPPPSAPSTSSPPLRPHPPGTNYDMRAPQDTVPQNYHIPTTSPQSNTVHGPPSQVPPASSFPSTNPTYVTPTMWQEVVASSFSDGLKRRWDHGNTSMPDQTMYKRAR